MKQSKLAPSYKPTCIDCLLREPCPNPKKGYGYHCKNWEWRYK